MGILMTGEAGSDLYLFPVLPMVLASRLAHDPSHLVSLVAGLDHRDAGHLARIKAQTTMIRDPKPVAAEDPLLIEAWGVRTLLAVKVGTRHSLREGERSDCWGLNTNPVSH